MIILWLQKNHSKINQTKSFNHENCANDTELLKDYWKIKRSNFFTNVTGTNARECAQYNLSKEGATCV